MPVDPGIGRGPCLDLEHAGSSPSLIDWPRAGLADFTPTVGILRVLLFWEKAQLPSLPYRLLRLRLRNPRGSTSFR